jgi:hypothetical protein
MLKGGKITVEISDSLSFSEERLQLLKLFLAYCTRALALEQEYSGFIVDSRTKYGIQTTAKMFLDFGEFYVYGKNRSFPDILRSIAHELTHISQQEDRELDLSALHFSSDEEDEANAVAGQLVNAFSAVIGYDIIYEGKREDSQKALGSRRDLGRNRSLRR